MGTGSSQPSRPSVDYGAAQRAQQAEQQRQEEARKKQEAAQLKAQQQDIAEAHTEVKDKQGKVVSWKDDSEWRRAEKNKQGQP